MKILAIVVVVIIIILQTFASGTMAEEMVNGLIPSPNSPISTSSGVVCPLRCTKNSDESYAVCASRSRIAAKYNLHPFSFAAKGPNLGDNMLSCDLFEADGTQSTSRAVCVKGYPGVNTVVYFHRVSDMINVTNVTIGATGYYPQVVVDTPNQTAYVSDYNNPPAIYKITNIGSSTPIFAATLPSFGTDEMWPAAMLIIDGFLYAHLHMSPAARLARVNILTFTWNQTVIFASGEYNWGESSENLANDGNFIYDLTQNGILIRCTYKNNNFARFDSLNIGFTDSNTLTISPDSSFLLLTAFSSGIVVVNTSSFSVESRVLLSNPTSTSYDDAHGRPIILSKNTNTNTYPVCAFTWGNDYLYTFSIARVPFRQIYPTIYPLASSPIKTSSGVKGSLQCTKNSDESYAVCASNSNAAVKYNLQPFSFAAKGPNQGTYMNSCDLYETPSQSSSRAVCTKNGNPSGIVYFHRISDMINVTNVTIGATGNYPHVIVDAPNQIAYISNYSSIPAIYKITNIGSSIPMFASTLSSFGFGDQNPVAMLIIDGYLYVHSNMDPASRLARINTSTFTWNQTVNFTSGESGGGYDNLANDDNFIYDLTQNGILVRCSYKNNNFARLDSLNTGYSSTLSLAISSDERTLFVLSKGNGVLQMVDSKSFAMFGNVVTVPSALGRPIVTSWCDVYAFSSSVDFVNTFLLNSPACQTRSAALSASRTGSTSTERSMTTSSSNSSSVDSSSVSLNTSASISTSASRLTASNLGTASATPSQLTLTGEATSSASHDTHSISADVSSTKSLNFTPSFPNISSSISLSVSRMKSSSFSLSQSASAIVPPPPYVSPLREVSVTMATTSSLLSLASMSSANVLGATRSRSALGQFNDIVSGTCSLDFKSLSELENNPPDRSSSPARFKLNGNYLTGQAVGNLVTFIGVGAVWILGYVVVNGQSEDKPKKKGNNNNKNNKLKGKKKSFVQLVIASNAHGMVFFVLMLLLAPTLTSSAMSLVGEIVVEGRNVTIVSVVCVVLSWFVLLVIGLGWSMWKLVHIRNFGDDVFELLDEEKDGYRQDTFWFRRFVEYTTSPFGEWKFKGYRKKQKILFQLARPFIESFTGKWPTFIVMDVAVIVILSLAEVIPRMIPDNSSACFIRGVVVCFVLSLHVLVVVFHRPLYTDRMSNTVGCFVDTLSVVVVAGAMSIDENNVSQIKGWSRAAIAQAGLQMIMSALQVIEVLLPVWDGGVKLWKKHCTSTSNKKKSESEHKRIHHQRHMTDFAPMMNQLDERDDSFSSPLLQEMALISRTENVSQSQNTKRQKKIMKRKLIVNWLAQHNQTMPK